jgi:hypothetical protein
LEAITGGQAESLAGGFVSGNYFGGLGVLPAAPGLNSGAKPTEP